jgi:hypothetical protein
VFPAVNARPGLTSATRPHMLQATGSSIKSDAQLSCTSSHISFGLTNFMALSTSRPSSRVAAAKQRLLLVNDPQAASFDSRNVGCALCGLNIVLEGGGDFNLTKWNEHKSICVKCVLSAVPSNSSLNIWL